MVIRKGECIRCGKCCESITLILFVDEKATQDQEDAGQDFLDWAAAHLGISIFREDKEKVKLTLKSPCQFLSYNKDNKAVCNNYEKRYEICKQFPERPSTVCKGFSFE